MRRYLPDMLYGLVYTSGVFGNAEICFYTQSWDNHSATMAVGVVDAPSESVFQIVMSLGPSRSE